MRPPTRPPPPLPPLSAPRPLELALDRCAPARRDPAALAALAAHPAAAAVVVRGGSGLVVGEEGGGGALAAARVPLTAVPPATLTILLGVDAGGAPLFGACVDAENDALVASAGANAAWAVVRDAAPRVAPPSDAAALALASQLARWHASSPRHPATGGETVPTDAGHARAAVAAEATSDAARTRAPPRLRPRVDPAVLVLATHGDHVLLGRKPGWPEGRYSLLAGYCEPGEGLEAAAARELCEEAGVGADPAAPPTYWGSQPWPASGSLMACIGVAVAGSGPDGGPPPARPADGELEAVAWFAAADVAAAAAPGVDRAPASGLALPGEHALARHVLRRWAAWVEKG